MQLTELSLRNILRIKRVDMKPDGSMVIVGGRNAQGKTSLLDSIVLLLGGRLAKHVRPLRDGQSKGEIVGTLSNGMTVTRNYSRKGHPRGTLTIEKPGGGLASSPQGILDEFLGALTFDPLAWCRMKALDRVELLREMLGVDFAEQDERRAGLFAKRTTANARVKELRAGVIEIDYKEVPQRVSVSELMEELEKRRINNDHGRELLADRGTLAYRIASIEQQIEALKSQLAETRQYHEETARDYEAWEERDTQEIKDQISSAESVNARFDEAAAQRKLARELEVEDAVAGDLTEKIAAIDEEKRTALELAQWPIDGLSIDDGDVTYNGVPFEQASSAEALRVSTAMGIAINKRLEDPLKVMLIRDGSLLDAENLGMIGEMAEKSGYQIWIERVGHGAECSVVLEDGEILEEEE